MRPKEKLYYISKNIYIDHEHAEVIKEMWTLSQLHTEVDRLRKEGFTCDVFRKGKNITLNVYLG